MISYIKLMADKIKSTCFRTKSIMSKFTRKKTRIRMKDKELIEMAKNVPYQYWWNIETLMEEAESEDTVEELRWIMRKKELLEQYKT